MGLQAVLTYVMPFDILACPQCGAPLPRQARWRMVECPRCGSRVTKSEQVVEAAAFRAALSRARAVESPGQEIHLGGRRFHLKARLGRGQSSEVFLAEHVGTRAGRAVLKVARTPEDFPALEAEAQILRRLRATPGLAEGFAMLRLTELEGFGLSEGPEARGRAVIVLRHQPGCWGTLADLRGGQDPRHCVWMWRRALGLLALLHDAGWVHSDLAPEHLLLHPQDHALHFVGWSAAKQVAGHDAGAAFSRDLAQVAWSLRSALCGEAPIEHFPGNVPAPLAELLERCCQDPQWAGLQGARGIDRLLKEASLRCFGPPAFLPFDPSARLAGPHP